MSAYPAIMQITFKGNPAVQSLHFENAEQGRVVCVQIFEAMAKIAQAPDTTEVQAASASLVFSHSVGMMLLRPADVAAIYFQDGTEEIAERLRSIKVRQAVLEAYMCAEQPAPLPFDLANALLIEGWAAQLSVPGIKDGAEDWPNLTEDVKDIYRDIARAKLAKGPT